ncbi:PadR family transcriptional regulator [bacterium RCC_150]
MGRSSVNGQLDLLLLGSLGAGEAHGYALIARVHERSGARLELREGSVYPALHKLEAAGWVASRWVDDADGRRRVYALTGAGRAELVRRAEEWKGFSAAVRGVLGAAS